MALRAPSIAVLATLAALPGCGLFGSRGPAPVDVVLVASDRLNPDEQGQSLPTVVRLYLLRSSAKLQGAEYGPVYGQPRETLGEELLMVEEVTVLPGQTVRRRLERDGGARTLAAVGLFRRPAGASWRAIVELPASGRQEFTFAIEGYRVERR
jgi:type VI secretion system protein VasD